MSFVYLGLAIAAEIVATSFIKTTDGFSRLWPTVGVLALYAVAFLFLAQAVRDLPVGLVYAMWAGLGTAAIVMIGAVFLGEPLSVIKVLGILLVIGGVVILNLGGAH
jgi:small multidrug resistance pump